VTLLQKIQPDKVYQLAAQSHLQGSFDDPELTADTTLIRMLQTDEPIDHVVATACPHTVRDFVEISCHARLDGETYVKLDERYLRQSTVDTLISEASKSPEVPDWTHRTLPPDLTRMPLESAIAEVKSRA